jgi:hypothetical protein
VAISAVGSLAVSNQLTTLAVSPTATGDILVLLANGRLGNNITGVSGGGATHNINISPGAIVINPAPGNDAASLAQTHVMVEDALDQLLSEYLAGSTPLTAAG